MALAKCCFCFALRTGVIIIGTVNSALPLVDLMLSDGSNGVFFIIVPLVYFVLSVLLIVGAYKNRRSFLLPWLIVQPIALIVLLVIIILKFVSLSTEDFTKEGISSDEANTKRIQMIVSAAQSCVNFAMHFYFFWVVKSFSNELKEGRTGKIDEQVQQVQI